MSLLLKRELLFWLIAMVCLAGYVVLGRQLAPDVPPKPEPQGGIAKFQSIREVAEKLAAERKAEQAWRDAFEARQQFLRTWYQYGAIGGIAFVLIYSWLRPPWREAVSPPAAKSGKTSKRKRRAESPLAGPSFFDALGLSPNAFFTMLATIVIIIALILAVAAWLK